MDVYKYNPHNKGDVCHYTLTDLTDCNPINLITGGCLSYLLITGNNGDVGH